MKSIWKRNKGLRKLIVAVIIIAFLGLAGCNIFINIFVDGLEQEHYRTIARLLSAVKKEYPEYSEEEWIKILNSESDNSSGEELLAQYGIDREVSVSVRNEKWIQGIVFSVSVILLSATVLICIAIIRYAYQRKKTLEEIVAYVQRVERGDYHLDIEENEEEEFSILKNELYKVTVLLKESAELSAMQKKALSDSVSDISHQLKTPLTSIMILLDNMTDNENMPWETRRKFLAEIIQQLTGMNWLVVTLLKLSKLDAGVVTFEEKEIVLDKICERAIHNLEIMAQWKQVEIVKTGESRSILKGDENWICEAFTNILKNAVEHSPEGSKIQVSIEDNMVYTSVVVRDYGEGMDQEEQKEVFNRFYTRKYADKNSIGIGLSLAKEIIRQQNGSITLHSEKGKGTWFTIKFYKECH